jgi:Tfp pilus assembly protein PilV
MKLPKRFSSERSEAGETLIEVLMSSVLMAIVVVAVIGGITTMLLGSTVHRDQTNANTALVGAMEKLKSPTVSRVCATNNSSHPYLTGLASGVSITTIEYETIDSSSGSPVVVWSSALPDCSLTSTLSVQRITLKYTSSNGNVNPPSCSSTATGPACLSFFKGDV